MSAIAFLPFKASIMNLSFSSSGFPASVIYITRSASFIRVFDFSTPILSMASCVFLMPAVSVISSITFPSDMHSSMASRVVPSISVTIALSSPYRRFKSDDLPTFGLPTIAVFIPFFKIFPLTELFIRASISLQDFFNPFKYSSSLSGSRSSSAKSMSTCKCDISSRRLFRIWLMLSERCPLS